MEVGYRYIIFYDNWW